MKVRMTGARMTGIGDQLIQSDFTSEIVKLLNVNFLSTKVLFISSMVKLLNQRIK